MSGKQTKTSISKEEYCQELNKAWPEMKQILTSFEALDEQIQRGHQCGAFQDATFPMAAALRDLEECWKSGHQKNQRHEINCQKAIEDQSK